MSLSSNMTIVLCLTAISAREVWPVRAIDAYATEMTCLRRRAPLCVHQTDSGLAGVVAER